MKLITRASARKLMKANKITEEKNVSKKDIDVEMVDIDKAIKKAISDKEWRLMYHINKNDEALANILCKKIKKAGYKCSASLDWNGKRNDMGDRYTLIIEI